MATVYVRQDGTGDYTSLAAAVSANETDIVISGPWENAENAEIVLLQDNTRIEAVGAAKHPGFVGQSPSHWRLRPTGTATYSFRCFRDNCTLIGLDIKSNANPSTGYILETYDVVNIDILDCIIWQDDTYNRYGIRCSGSLAASAFNLTNCIIFGTRLDGIICQCQASLNVTVNINSCAVFNCNTLNLSGHGGVTGYQTAGTLSINVFNTISLNNLRADFALQAGSATWNIDYCIDSDGSINSRDGGAVGCLTSMNPTDDDSKTSDGDWIIFRDISNSPFDFRLAYNAYNEAIEMHASGSGSGLTMPVVDLLAKPREIGYSCGPYQMPWIVQENGDYDYTTLKAAVDDDKINIEIWGPWVSAENVAPTAVNNDNTFIEAIGESKNPGYVGDNPTHHRIRINLYTWFGIQAANVTLKGLDIQATTASGATLHAISISAPDADSNYKFIDCLLSDSLSQSTNSNQGIRLLLNYARTCNILIENCVIFSMLAEGIYLRSSTNGAQINAIINGCTLYDNARAEITAGIYGYSGGGAAINIGVFNSINFVNSALADDFGDNSDGGLSWDINYCIDSDGTIEDMDGGAVGCLINHIATDDSEKSSDGDWIIFKNISTEPYDLRLVENAYNEAIDLHSAGGASGYPLSEFDIIGEGRVAPYSCGAIENAILAHFAGTAAFGQSTGVSQANALTFAGNWTGTGSIVGSGDGEGLVIGPGQYMEMVDVINVVGEVSVIENFYAVGYGDQGSLKYKQGATSALCLADSWHDYSGPFTSGGYVLLRLERSA
jgi:hypothetical protein